MRKSALAFALGVACSGPIVQERVHEVSPQSLARIAVAPFVAGPGLQTPPPPQPEAPADPDRAPEVAPTPQLAAPEGDPAERVAASDAAALATRFVSEEFAERGFEIVPAGDLVRAFEAAGFEVPHGDPLALARLAASEFGATALLRGRVDRYRERDGGELGATRPASVGFQLVLRAAPGGRTLWSSRFDHTQRAISEDVFRAPRYPGGGTRWLSAAELTRWGAGQAADRLIEHK